MEACGRFPDNVNQGALVGRRMSPMGRFLRKRVCARNANQSEDADQRILESRCQWNLHGYLLMSKDTGDGDAPEERSRTRELPTQRTADVDAETGVVGRRRRRAKGISMGTRRW